MHHFLNFARSLDHELKLNHKDFYKKLVGSDLTLFSYTCQHVALEQLCILPLQQFDPLLVTPSQFQRTAAFLISFLTTVEDGDICVRFISSLIQTLLSLLPPTIPIHYRQQIVSNWEAKINQQRTAAAHKFQAHYDALKSRVSTAHICSFDICLTLKSLIEFYKRYHQTAFLPSNYNILEEITTLAINSIKAHSIQLLQYALPAQHDAFHLTVYEIKHISPERYFLYKFTASIDEKLLLTWNEIHATWAAIKEHRLTIAQTDQIKAEPASPPAKRVKPGPSPARNAFFRPITDTDQSPEEAAFEALFLELNSEF